jgi:hypothetical protein
MADPPKLSAKQWYLTSALGVIFLVAAILQAVSFGDFEKWLESLGFGSSTVWAVGLIVAEVWAALGFFRLPLMNGFRKISSWLAILVSGFWFIQTLRLVSEGAAGDLQNSGYFGGFLAQTPSWWTVIGVTVVLLMTTYSLKLTDKGWSKV